MKNVSPTPLSDIAAPISTELQAYRKLFESTLHHQTPLLGEALDYLRSREGKMMRPILVLLIAKEVGEINENVLISAVALELLHTASLVHDDVVDKSDMRRGRESLNKLFDNKISILVGDFLLSLLLQKASETNDRRIVERIAKLGGTLAEGEILQLYSSRQQLPNEEAYFNIITHKTAALFATCAELGAIAAGGNEEIIEKARLYGQYIGICFQIRDDIFDFFDNKEIGKPTGNDLLEGKFTLPIIHALSTQSDEELIPMVERVKMCQATTDDVKALIAFTKAANGIAYAQDVMNDYCEKALQIAQGFKDERVRKSLIDYAHYVTARNF